MDMTGIIILLVTDVLKKFVNAVNGEFDTTEYSAKIKSELEKSKVMINGEESIWL